MSENSAPKQVDSMQLPQSPQNISNNFSLNQAQTIENSHNISQKSLSEKKMIERAHSIGNILQGKNPQIIEMMNMENAEVASDKIENPQKEENLTFREKILLGASSVSAAVGGFFWKNRRKKSEKNSRK